MIWMIGLWFWRLCVAVDRGGLHVLALWVCRLVTRATDSRLVSVLIDLLLMV